jgi:glycosyltransferase involved in cell wall biosynthesis
MHTFTSDRGLKGSMKVSVVIPTYNEERNIERCLLSLRRQTFPEDEYELIVVDGNSIDRTREIAEPLADRVIIQTSKKVGGARNDGGRLAEGSIIATTDADCIIPPGWIDEIVQTFSRDPRIVQIYGPVDPIEPGIRNRMSLELANGFSRIGYMTRAFYFTLGCNTAFRKAEFIQAGMYRCVDAGDDIEIARRMSRLGYVVRNPRMRVGFSMRRYDQFGTLKSLYEWAYIVAKGGETDKYRYIKREYKK